MEAKFIENIQEAFKEQSEKKQGSVVTGPAANNKPTPKKDDNPDSPAPDPGGMDLSKFFKEKHGIDLPEDEILKLVKGQKKDDTGGSGSPAPSRKAPTKDDVPEEDVLNFLKVNGKEAVFTKHADRSKKDDLAIVKESYAEQMKTLYPDMEDSRIDTLFNEQYFISEDPDLFSEEEKTWGQHLIKAEAGRMRGGDEMVLDNVKNLLYSQRLQTFQQEQYAATVDAFMATAPKKLSIPIGKSGNKDLGTFDFDVAETIPGSVAEIMKNPAKLADKFKGEDGNIDLGKLYDLLLGIELRETIQKSLASHYHSQGVSEVEETLHNNPDLNTFGKRVNKGKDKEIEEAKDFNQKQIQENTGRGSQRRRA